MISDPRTDTTVDIDHIRRRIVVITRGPFDVFNLEAAIDRQATSGLWHYAMLYDERDSTTPPHTLEMRRLADRVTRLIKTLGRRGPVAVVTADEATYGMARMYEAFVGNTGLNVKVFREITPADAWLSAQSTHMGRLLEEQPGPEQPKPDSGGDG
jgi:hypothetical protein